MTFNRRDLFKLGGAALVGSLGRSDPAFGQQVCSGLSAIEDFPTSPLILEPFRDPMPIPAPLRPVPAAEVAKWSNRPGPGIGQQDSDGGTHQIWPSKLGLPDPIIYQIKLQVRPHSFTSSKVQTLVPYKNTTGQDVPAGTIVPKLPDAGIYGFNGTFPGPMIYARYGHPCIVRFENHLDENPFNIDRQDFGAPDWAFLTHLHNGHTAPESDGNPHYRPSAYRPGQWVDNMYLNWAAGGDERECQSFFWFHDHRMDHTGANVYKGMVGLFPIYDPDLDPGDENKGLHLPGVPNDRTGRVDYDIPIALYDCRLEDGATRHQDFHNGCGELHPEWWGKTFFRHFPNHGFVGDIFTVNGKAYPVLNVERRKYRLRFLDCSISRIYELMLMRGTPVASPFTLGQYLLPDGQQCMKWVQIAAEGGLLTAPIVRDSFEIWPAKRREMIVDFTKYMDGSPTHKGDVIYLTNILPMDTGRKPGDPNPAYRVPLLKIVIGDLPRVPDRSVIPSAPAGVTCLRDLPPCPTLADASKLPQRKFTLQRGGFGGEIEWLINGRPFDPTVALAFPKQGSAEVWTIENGGGGWVHPLHLHMEEHQVLSRTSAKPHPDDKCKEDVVALEPSERVVVYRKFRTFIGPYVAHCHNLAHEDHAMMFGWAIVP